MRRPVDDFASEARAILQRCREEGLDFASAWDRTASEVRPADSRTWGQLQDGLVPLEDETPLTFLHRHMRAAYVGRKASPRHEDTDDRRV